MLVHTFLETQKLVDQNDDVDAISSGVAQKLTALSTYMSTIDSQELIEQVLNTSVLLHNRL